MRPVGPGLSPIWGIVSVVSFGLLVVPGFGNLRGGGKALHEPRTYKVFILLVVTEPGQIFVLPGMTEPGQIFILPGMTEPGQIVILPGMTEPGQIFIRPSMTELGQIVILLGMTEPE
ncbi:hypothetical protein Dimus_033989 [Dionaea muscipula]